MRTKKRLETIESELKRLDGLCKRLTDSHCDNIIKFGEIKGKIEDLEGTMEQVIELIAPIIAKHLEKSLSKSLGELEKFIGELFSEDQPKEQKKGRGSPRKESKNDK